MALRVTEAESAAQRRILGIVHTSSVLSSGGLAMWREFDAGEWNASAAELSADLNTLRVVHEIVIAYRPPRARETRVHKGQEVRVAFPELPQLVRWLPSLRQPIDELPVDMPGFTFVYCEPRATGMEMMLLSSFAAEWPTWTDRQAYAMGLMCARCGFDLRTRGDGKRLAYNIPEQAGRRRLMCGECCNDGLTELERLSARPTL